MQPTNLVQDVTARQTGAAPASQSSEELIKMELEHNIPVKQPGTPTNIPAPAPVAGPAHHFSGNGSANGKHIDGIFKDVSREVKDLANVGEDVHHFSLKELFGNKPKSQAAAPQSAPAKPQTNKPVFAMAVAVIVGVGLSLAAVYAFR
jgi:hypothetical protein